MERIKKIIEKRLNKHKIVVNVSKIIDEMITSSKINEFMSIDTIYTSLLLSLSSTNGVFKQLISNEKYLYDMEVFIHDHLLIKELEGLSKEEINEMLNPKMEHLHHLLVDAFGERAEYIYISFISNSFFVGIKFASSCYSSYYDKDVPKAAIPYNIFIEAVKDLYSIQNIKFTEVIFDDRPVYFSKDDLNKKQLNSFFSQNGIPRRTTKLEEVGLMPDDGQSSEVNFDIAKYAEGNDGNLTSSFQESTDLESDKVDEGCMLGKAISLHGFELLDSNHNAYLKYTVNYQLAFSNYNKREHMKYNFIVNHLKKLRLPLDIVDDDCFFIDTSLLNIHDVYLRMQSSSAWPKHKRAVDCVKTSFYCCIYKKSSFRHSISYDSVILHYQNSFFRIQILLKDDTKIKASKMIQTALNRHPLLQENIKYVKKFLGAHGYYPIYMDDLIIDFVGLVVGVDDISYGRFFRNFGIFKWKIGGCVYDISKNEFVDGMYNKVGILSEGSCVYVTLPDEVAIRRLRLLFKKVFTGNFSIFDSYAQLQSWKLLVPSFREYDFVLCDFYRGGFKKIKDITNNNNRNEKEFTSDDNTTKKYHIQKQVSLGSPDYRNVFTDDVLKRAYVYFSLDNKVIMVKMRDNNSPALLCLYLMTVTKYRYLMDTNILGV